MKFKIELKKHQNVVSAPEYIEELDFGYDERMINERIAEIETSFEEFTEGTYDEIDQEELESLKHHEVGSYSFDCGDYTYLVDIVGETV